MNLAHRFDGDELCLGLAGVQYRLDLIRVGFVVGPSFPDRGQMGRDALRRLELALNAAQGAGPAVRVDFGGFSGIEFLVVGKDEADLRTPRIAAPLLLRIGHRRLHPLGDLLG